MPPNYSRRKGRSARARAFEFFDKGLRTRQLPDIGLPRNTLYRYFQACKHHDEEQIRRIAGVWLQCQPYLQQLPADNLSLEIEDVKEACNHRNVHAALDRRIEDLLVALFDNLDEASAAEIKQMGQLLRGYRGRHRRDAIRKFAYWGIPQLQAKNIDAEEHFAILKALVGLDDEVQEIIASEREALAAFGIKPETGTEDKSSERLLRVAAQPDLSRRAARALASA